MTLKLGVNINEIKDVVKNINPPPHRLNLIENNGKFILDDSFNANTEGVYYALDVLKTFKNKKIVITCGIVELGKDQYAENFKLGQNLKEFDVVIITNLTNKVALSEGLKGSNNKVYYANNLALATEILKTEFNSKDCVLFLNDLPDNYK